MTLRHKVRVSPTGYIVMEKPWVLPFSFWNKRHDTKSQIMTSINHLVIKILDIIWRSDTLADGTGDVYNCFLWYNCLIKTDTHYHDNLHYLNLWYLRSDNHVVPLFWSDAAHFLCHLFIVDVYHKAQLCCWVAAFSYHVYYSIKVRCLTSGS